MKKFLSKDLGGIKLYMPLSMMLLAIVGIIIGSFLDLQLTQAIYSKGNFWSTFVEFGGTFLTSIVCGASGSLLFHYFDKSNIKNKDIWKWVLLIAITLAAGIYWGFDTFHRHTELGFVSKAYFYAPIGFIAVGVFQVGMFFFTKNGDEKTYLKKSLVLLLGFTITIAITFLIKYVNARPRYMWIMAEHPEDINVLYRNWYQFASKKYFEDMYGEIYSYNLQSWPSGHASFSCLVILGFVLASCNEKTKGKEVLLYFLGVLWCLGIMVARIMDGHHYLSDVSTGFLITLLGTTIVLFFIYRDKTKKVEVEETN